MLLLKMSENVADKLACRIQPDAPGIEHQMIVMRFSPFVSRIIFIVMDTVTVYSFDLRFSLPACNSVFIDTSVYRIVQVSITENL